MKTRKTMYFILAVVLVLSLSVIAAGCQSSSKDEAAVSESVASSDGGSVEPKNGEKYVIGFSLATVAANESAVMKNLVEEKCAELGWEVVVTDAEDSTEKQMTDIEALIERDIDAIIIFPIDSQSILPATEKLNAAGIPIFAVLRNIPDGDIVNFSGANDYEIGRLAGNCIAIALGGEGKVVEVQGLAGTSTAQGRAEGFKDVIEGYSGIEVLARQPGDYERSKAMEVFEAMLQAYPEIDAVWTHSDEMSGGIRQAIASAERTEVKVVSCNVKKEAWDAIVAGDHYADITFPPQMVLLSMEAIEDYFKGNTVANVSYVTIDLVTAGNAAAFEDVAY